MTAPALPRESTVACQGNNHVPDCEHFPAPVPETLQQLEVRLIAVGANVRPDPGALDDLAASIQQRGVLSPVKVEPAGDGTFVLVYGQRRLAAAKLAGLTHIPAIVAAAAGLTEPGAKRSIEQLVENLEQKASKKVAEDDLRSIETKLAKVPKDAEIHVPNPYYGSSDTRRAAIAKLLAEAGFTNVKVGAKDVAGRAAALGCDCKAWKVEPQYERLLIGPACVKPAHVRAKQKAADDKRQEKYALEGRVKARLRELGPKLAHAVELPGDTVVLGLEPMLARMALWDSLGSGVADWAEKRGGLRTRPWPTIAALSHAELAKELGASLARAFSDQFGYHLPWDQLAAELGVGEEPKAEPKPKRAAKPK